MYNRLKKQEFKQMGSRWVLAVSFVTWPALIAISVIYYIIVFDPDGRLAAVKLFGVTAQKGLKSESSSDMQDKLLGGLLAAGFDEGSCLSRYQSTLYRKNSHYKASSYLISRLRKYEALHKRCGPNTEPYNKTLRQLQAAQYRNIRMECSYVVWISYNGLGNKLLTMASAFLYAILTDRVLLVEQEKNTADLFCEPFRGTTWVLPSDFPIKNHFYSFNETSPHCFGNMLRNNIVNTSTNQSLPAFLYINLIYNSNDDDKLFFCDQHQTLIEKVPWLIMKSDQYFIPALFLMPSFKEELGKIFPENETVFHHLGRYLFHPSNQVWGLITRYYEAYLAKANEKIGIQIRIYNTPTLPFQNFTDLLAGYHLPHVDEVDFYNGTSPFLNTMDRILSCTMKENLLPQVNSQRSFIKPPKNPKLKAVLVTSLSSLYYEIVRNLYWENPTVTGEKIGVYQPSHEESQQTEKATHNMKAWAEIYLLSLMDVLVTSPWSTFGYVAQGLGGLKPWILNQPDQKMPLGDPPCYQTKSMEPCFHFPPLNDCEAKRRTDTGKLVPHVRHCEDAGRGLKLYDIHK